MTNDATPKDSMKIKMDTYTKQLYEDFVSALSDRLRDTADSTASQLGQIYKSLDALRDQVKEPKEVLLKQIDDLVSQLNDIVKDHDNKLLSDITKTIDTLKSNLQITFQSGKDELFKYFDTLNTVASDIANMIKTSPDVINDKVNQSIASLNNELVSSIQDNSDSVTNRVNEHIHSEMEILNDSFTSNIQDSFSTVKDLQNEVLFELQLGNDTIDKRISKVLGLASIHVKRFRFTENLIYKSLKTFIDSESEFRYSSDAKISHVLSNNLEQISISTQLLDLSRLINSEISRIVSYVASDKYNTINELINSSVSNARDHLEDKINRVAMVVETHYPDMKEFISLQNKDIAVQVIDTLAKRSEANRDEVLQAISTSETNEIERTKMAYKDVTDKVDASIRMLSDQHNELLQTLNSLHEELVTRHQDLSEKNDALTEQVKTNQELLIWILTPWYRKIFRRKNGKPQILAKKPVAESEDN
ncbi:MAG: hypothetical protein WC179_08360 [Candidatus Cloacimonadaceae bacterium]|jgi:gas vesicle protein|nr:hypothetical protein [Candidatus Cloacimonadota bacterium]